MQCLVIVTAVDRLDGVAAIEHPSRIVHDEIGQCLTQRRVCGQAFRCIVPRQIEADVLRQARELVQLGNVLWNEFGLARGDLDWHQWSFPAGAVGRIVRTDQPAYAGVR